MVSGPESHIIWGFWAIWSLTVRGNPPELRPALCCRSSFGRTRSAWRSAWASVVSGGLRQFEGLWGPQTRNPMRTQAVWSYHIWVDGNLLFRRHPRLFSHHYGLLGPCWGVLGLIWAYLGWILAAKDLRGSIEASQKRTSISRSSI